MIEQTGQQSKREKLSKRVLIFLCTKIFIIRLNISGLWWKTLHTFGLGAAYSKALCRLNFYKKFNDGRCMWCGGKH